MTFVTGRSTVEGQGEEKGHVSFLCMTPPWLRIFLLIYVSFGFLQLKSSVLGHFFLHFSQSFSLFTALLAQVGIKLIR